MMIRYVLISVVLLFLNGCSSKLVPLKATVNSVDVKIINPDKGRYYKLYSTLSAQFPLDSRVADQNGMIHFDMNKTRQERIINCFYVSDGSKIIPIKEKSYKFFNPAFENYVRIKTQLDNELPDFMNSQSRLLSNNAYQNGQCVLLTISNPPARPSNACNKQEESMFISQQCPANNTETGIVTKIGDSLVCAGAGGAVAWLNPILGLAAGVICDLSMDEMNKDNEYKECAQRTLDNCRYYYNNWLYAVNQTNQYPEKLRQECVRSLSNFQAHSSRVNEIEAELKYATQIESLITDANYCY